MAAVNFPDPSASPWTNPDNGVTYEYASGVWRVVGGGSSLDDRYVKVAGDNMIGSLTIGPEGGPAVTTLSLAGGGTFSEDVSTQVAGTVARTGISKDGALGITRVANNDDSALTVVADGSLNVDVKASGAATFEAGVNVRTQDAARGLTVNSGSGSQMEAIKVNANGGEQKILLKHDGSGTFAGEIAASGKIKSDRSSGTSDCFSASLNGDTNAIVRADGTVRIGELLGLLPTLTCHRTAAPHLPLMSPS